MTTLKQHLCACGCGRETNIARRAAPGYKQGDHYRYVNGHSNRGPRLPFTGDNLAPSTKAVAHLLGVDRTMIYRWRRHGVTLDRAEWIADQLGKHPSELFDDYYEVSACE